MKVFYDHLIVFDDIESEINSLADSTDERHELWHIVDDILHHRVLDFILGHLAEEHHQEYLNHFHKAPHDEILLGYLKHRLGHDFEDLLKQELGSVAVDLLAELRR